MTSEQARSYAIIAAEIHIKNVLMASQLSRSFDDKIMSGYALKKLANCFEAYIMGTEDIPDKSYQKREMANGPICCVHQSLHETLLSDENIQD